MTDREKIVKIIESNLRPTYVNPDDIFNLDAEKKGDRTEFYAFLKRRCGFGGLLEEDNMELFSGVVWYTGNNERVVDVLIKDQTVKSALEIILKIAQSDGEIAQFNFFNPLKNQEKSTGFYDKDDLVYAS